MNTNQESNDVDTIANGVKADEIVNGPDCQNCGHNQYVVRIAWGMIATNAGSVDRHPTNRFFLGGAATTDQAWHCNKCGANF
jgi:ribosomal protein L37AE/L43A